MKSRERKSDSLWCSLIQCGTLADVRILWTWRVPQLFLHASASHSWAVLGDGKDTWLRIGVVGVALAVWLGALFGLASTYSLVMGSSAHALVIPIEHNSLSDCQRHYSSACAVLLSSCLLRSPVLLQTRRPPPGSTEPSQRRTMGPSTTAQSSYRACPPIQPHPINCLHQNRHPSSLQWGAVNIRSVMANPALAPQDIEPQFPGQMHLL